MMRVFAALAILLTLAGFAPDTPDLERVKQELRSFAVEQNRARREKDRAAMERLYADEFLFVHAFGYVDDKRTVIDEAMEELRPPEIPLPTFEPPQSLHVSGDFAVVRNPLGRTGLDTPAWATSIYVRRDGRWQLLQRQATELVVLPKLVALRQEDLAAYVGSYRTSAGGTVRVERRGDALFTVSQNLPPRKLLPVGEDQFTTKLGGNIRFQRDARGKVTGYTNLFRTRETTATRID